VRPGRSALWLASLAGFGAAALPQKRLGSRVRS